MSRVLQSFRLPSPKREVTRGGVKIVRQPTLQSMNLEDADLVFVEGQEPRSLKTVACDVFTFFVSKSIPIIIMVIFTIIGGYIFNRCEFSPPDVEGAKAERAAYVKNMEHWTSKIRGQCEKATNHFARKVALLKFLEDHAIRPPNMSEPYNWGQLGATFFAATLYTTLGYGSFAPVTFWGQLATIMYSLVGIPIFLIMLASWGKLLFRIFKWFTITGARLFGKFCVCYRRKLKQNVEKIKESDETALPTWLAIALLTTWILGCAGFFRLIEPEWDFFKGVYFFFISLTTIGLGDVTPTKHKSAVLTFPLIWAGLAVVSMCISILQNNLEAFMKRIVGKVEQQYAAQLAAGADGEIDLAKLKSSMSWRERILFSMMDDSKIHTIEEAITKRNQLHSIGTQTTSGGVEIMIQAGDGLGPSFGSGDEDETQANQGTGKQRLRAGLKRSYIYNSCDGMREAEPEDRRASL